MASTILLCHQNGSPLHEGDWNEFEREEELFSVLTNGGRDAAFDFSFLDRDPVVFNVSEVGGAEANRSTAVEQCGSPTGVPFDVTDAGNANKASRSTGVDCGSPSGVVRDNEVPAVGTRTPYEGVILPCANNLQADFLEAYQEGFSNKFLARVDVTKRYLLSMVKDGTYNEERLFRECLGIHKFLDNNSATGWKLTSSNSMSEGLKNATERMMDLCEQRAILKRPQASRIIHLSLFIGFGAYAIDSHYSKLKKESLGREVLLRLIAQQKTERNVLLSLMNMLLVFEQFDDREGVLLEAIFNENPQWWMQNTFGDTDEESLDEAVCQVIGERCRQTMFCKDDTETQLLFVKWRCQYLLGRTDHTKQGSGKSRGGGRKRKMAEGGEGSHQLGKVIKRVRELYSLGNDATKQSIITGLQTVCDNVDGEAI